MSVDHNPVWVVYDLYKTARLNRLYYTARLHHIERLNTFIEIVIAIAAPTSAVTGIWLLKTEFGQEAWKYIAGLAAIAAAIKPILKLSQKIKSLEQCLSGYRALEYDVEQIVNKVKTERAYTKAAQKLLDEAQRKKKVLVCNPPETRQDAKLIDRICETIDRELPAEFFYVPEISNE